ncbi:MAG: Uma2 family endonuclease [Saprospiraceae bacterium]
MRTAISNRVFSIDEYIQHEWVAERKHEFINGQLFEMPGEKDINNELALNFVVLFKFNFLKTNYTIYAHDVKIKIPNEDKIYYPDVFLTKEAKTDKNKYVKNSPEIIVEVVSPSSQINDYVDKFLDYTKIPVLEYYIIVEPETTLITVYFRSQNGWEASKYSNINDEVDLPKFGFKFKLPDIYSGK